MVWFGAIAELTSVGATTFISLVGNTRIMASPAAQRTAASEAGDPSTPTTMDGVARLHIRVLPLEVPLVASSRRHRSRSLWLGTASPRRRCRSGHSQQHGYSDGAQLNAVRANVHNSSGIAFNWRRRRAGRAPSVPRSLR